MKKCKIFFAICILLLSTSCGDCLQIVSGVVLDANTKIPIGEVKVIKKEKVSTNTLSNDKGIFILEDISGGFQCPAMTLLFIKKGYDTLQLEIAAGDSMTVLMKALPPDQPTAFLTLENISNEFTKHHESIDREEHKQTVSKILNTM